LFQRIERFARPAYPERLAGMIPPTKPRRTNMADAPRKSGIDEEEEAVGSRHLFISLIAGLVLIVIGMIAVFSLVH
jgi:hypothetical protein